MSNYRLIGGAICRQDVPGGDWIELSKDEANTLLSSEGRMSRSITQGDIDMAKHFARDAFWTTHGRANATGPEALEAALSKMVECLKP